MNLKPFILPAILLLIYFRANGQHNQQGLVFKASSNIRLAGVKVINKRSKAFTITNLYGMFNIQGIKGDTLQFSQTGFTNGSIVIRDFNDQLIYLIQAEGLNEILIREYSLKKDLLEANRVYRSKGVFYTGTPHYYYLFLKPMTFIYENFKSEVKNARKFKKYTARELQDFEIYARFNDSLIIKYTGLSGDWLIDFKSRYKPSYSQIRQWNDLDLVKYVNKCYLDYQKDIK